MTSASDFIASMVQQGLFASAFFLLIFCLGALFSHGLSFRFRSLMVFSYFLVLLLPAHEALSGLTPNSNSKKRLWIQLSEGSPAESLRQNLQQSSEIMDQTWLIYAWAVGAVVSLTLLVLVPWLRQRRFQSRFYSQLNLSPFIDCNQNELRGAEIFQDEAIQVPFVSGVVKPQIFLPQKVQGGAVEGKELRAIVLHEVAHIAHRDLLMILLARLSACLFWFVPTNYFAYKLMRQHQEDAADEFALCRLGEGAKKSYARALVHVALGENLKMRESLQLGLFNNKDLTRRLRMIQGFQEIVKRSLVVPTLIVLGASVAAFAVTQKEEPKRQYYLEFDVIKDHKVTATPRLVTLEGEDAEVSVADEEWIRSLKVNAQARSESEVGLSIDYCLEKKPTERLPLDQAMKRKRNCQQELKKTIIAVLGEEEHFRGPFGMEYKMYIREYQGN